VTNTDDINCCFCDKKITRLYSNKVNTLERLTDLMYKGGGVAEISLGYGSKFDGDTYFIPICDDCISQMTKDQKIFFIYNYMRSM